MPDTGLAELAELSNELPDELPRDLPAELPDEPEPTAEPDFEATMTIAPDASQSNKAPGDSTEAFIERVKKQLSESPSEEEEEPFTSTVRQ